MIRLLHDPWLKEEATFYVNIEGTPALEDIRVSDLLQVDGMDWENDLLNGLLAPMDVECVRCVPISLLKPSDQLIWHFSKPGSYDVKSGYVLAIKKFSSLGISL
ncbi:hypothetical protein ES332_D13G051500v1 [Gossypium tomentosum]|uniref:Uncharacterized protein n=1 Tax=Gossypium tomentosum TaxID=34277 RepID=A0A5D2HUW3_GOSTO|nr:hypothetical protein ES332_D13G051500v1 [Gossypium tomentosum]